MSAYPGGQPQKDAILAQLEAHRRLDQLVKGQYWRDGKGCAVGCTLHDPHGGHAEYEPQFGIPQMLARLEDTIFEGLPNEDAQAWPMRFMDAIQPGADLFRVGWQFLHWLLTDEGVNSGISHPLVSQAVSQCAGLLNTFAQGGTVSEKTVEMVVEATMEAQLTAAKAKREASDPGLLCTQVAAEVATHAALALEVAVKAEEETAEKAEEWAAEAAMAASEATMAVSRAARAAAYQRMADKLISLLEAAPCSG